MIDRRRFVKTLGAATGAIAVGLPHVVAQAEERKKRLERIGLQLYTVRGDMEKDFEGTLKKVADIGYKQVEFAGYFGRSPAQVRTILHRVHLEAPSAHIGTPAALTKDWEKTLENSKATGHKYVFVAYVEENRRTLDDYRRYADLFNSAGELARNVGLRFGYHNHDFEFVPSSDGKLPYDILLERTDPKLVTMEMDLFWVTKGGKNPLDYFARYPGRFEAVHVKDMDASGHMVDVGKGKIDFARIFAQQKKAGIRYFFVEHDNPEPSAIGSITASYKYLEKLKF